MDAVHRHQLTRPNLFENVISDPSASVACGVGFADLSGFTELTQVLSPADLSTLLSGFSAAVSDVVHADEGRLVKFIGDAVMWVSSTPESLVKTATDLVNDPRTREAGLRVRAGLRLWPSSGHQRRLLRQCGELGRSVGGRCITRADPRLVGYPRRAAGLDRDSAGSFDTQGLRRAGYDLRHEPVRPAISNRSAAAPSNALTIRSLPRATSPRAPNIRAHGWAAGGPCATSSITN